jgi:hypothetical protein
VWSRCLPGEKVDVVRVVEHLKLILCSLARGEDVHPLVKTVAEDEMVRERETVRLHRMPFLQDPIAVDEQRVGWASEQGNKEARGEQGRTP